MYENDYTDVVYLPVCYIDLASIVPTIEDFRRAIEIQRIYELEVKDETFINK